MDHMFFDCEKLEDGSVLDNWNVEKLENMDLIFEGCKSLKQYPKWFLMALERQQKLIEEKIRQEQEEKIRQKLKEEQEKEAIKQKLKEKEELESNEKEAIKQKLKEKHELEKEENQDS
jgi:precorrin-6B methylase 2